MHRARPPEATLAAFGSIGRRRRKQLSPPPDATLSAIGSIGRRRWKQLSPPLEASGAAAGRNSLHRRKHRAPPPEATLASARRIVPHRRKHLSPPPEASSASSAPSMMQTQSTAATNTPAVLQRVVAGAPCPLLVQGRWCKRPDTAARRGSGYKPAIVIASGGRRWC